MEKSKINSGFAPQTIKAVMTALITTLIAVLIFAGVLKFTFLGGGVIKAVNQFIKILSVFIGCFFFLSGKAGWLKGFITGALYSLLVTLIFALIIGEISFGLSFIVDMAFTAVIGAICGIISVNIKK